MFDIAAGFVYTLIKDATKAVFTWSNSHKRKLSPEYVVAKREKWKSEVEKQLFERRQKGHGLDIVVRDIRRLDEYPDIKANRGISPWFKSGLMATYHRGVQLGLSWETLTRNSKGQWRRTNYAAGETGELRVICMGFVPFERIEAINWDGDEYYGEPHIYCHFEGRHKEPYERVAYCEERELNGYPYYTEIIDYESVRKLSKKR
jgi:hypothetical protein